MLSAFVLGSFAAAGVHAMLGTARWVPLLDIGVFVVVFALCGIAADALLGSRRVA